MRLGRRSSVLAVAVVGMLAVGTMLGTAPAMAKGEHQGPPHPWRCPVGGDPYCPPGHVSITGPGLDRPLTIGGRDFWTVEYLTGAGYRPFGYAEPSSPATSALGPRYRATYVVEPKHGRVLSMVQDLYPYAPGLVWAFTRGGQRFRSDVGGESGFTTPGGWWHSAALLEVLVAHGLPATAPATTTSASGAAGALGGPGSGGSASGNGTGGPGGPGGPGGRVWIGIAALAALLLAGAVAARPRRSTTEVGR
jgi:hypothetical protein